MRKWMFLSVLVLAFAAFVGVYAIPALCQTGGDSAHQSPKAGTALMGVLELRDQITPGQTYGVDPPMQPAITVRNETNQSIKLLIRGGSIHTLEPRSMQKIALSAGSFGYEAQISGFPPLAGQAAFNVNTEYTWVFYYAQP
jgi:hypothetical protein